MAVLIRPRAWAHQKPPAGTTINWGHPLALGLRVCYPFNEGGGLPRDLARADQMAALSSMSGWDNAGLAQSNVALLGMETTDLTLPTFASSAAFGKWRSTASQINSWGVSPGAGDDVARFGGHAPYSDNTVYFDYGGASGANRISVASLVFADDDWMFTAGPLGSAIMQNGTVQATQATPITRTVSATSRPVRLLGDANGAVSTETSTRYRYFYIWERQLTIGEAQWVAAEPYAFFAPPAPKILYFPVVSGPESHITSIRAALALTGASPAKKTTTKPILAPLASTVAAPAKKTGTQPVLAPVALTASPAAKKTATTAVRATVATTVASAAKKSVTGAVRAVLALIGRVGTDTTPTRDIDYRLGPPTTGWQASTVETSWRADQPTT